METGGTTDSLDYLQRSGSTPRRLSHDATLTEGRFRERRLLHVSGIGRYEKSPGEFRSPQPGRQFRLPTSDAWTGLYGHRVPFAFVVDGDGPTVSLAVGTWSPAPRERTSAARMNERAAIVESVVRGAYASVRLTPCDAELPDLPFAGLAVGVPSVATPEKGDPAFPIDRLIRTMTGERWAVLVLAEPIGESVIAAQRHRVLNELRSVEGRARAEGSPSPLADHYKELLTRTLKDLTHAQAVGGWRTGVYLLGTESGYARLAGAWRAIFSGEDSLPEPVRVFPAGTVAAEFAMRWALPDEPAAEGPGFYSRLFEHQTLLTTTQLAVYAHMPHLEAPGFSIDLVPQFDAVPRSGAGHHLSIGNVIHATTKTASEYSIEVDDLTRHAFVSGVTGSGKTNTVMSVLADLDRRDVPFLVIEPAKREYRGLARNPRLTKSLQIFTLGDEQTSPLRMNPFEVPVGTPLSVHLDLLKSLFAASFGMWNPLPQILETCLYAIYADRGWDVTSGVNDRVTGAPGAESFPTLGDLAAKAEEVIAGLDYVGEVVSNMRAALQTRINGLRIGGKGRMLDVTRSFPFEPLLHRPTVLELEGLGDDDDRAFVMGLLLIRLAEVRRAQPETHHLRHVLVIEEAHRLLANVAERSQEDGNPRGKAVEAFANMLAEIRAYGQGVVVADQVPTKLSPDVIKNTNLKIAHRIVAEDDRKTLGGAMAMNDTQIKSLSTLDVGVAAMFSEGDDGPVLVQVHPAAARTELDPPTNASVAQRMAKWRQANRLGRCMLPLPACEGVCASSGRACDVARTITESAGFHRQFAHLALSTLVDPSAVARLWVEIDNAVRARLRPGVDQDELTRCTVVRAATAYTQRRGAQAGWSYEDTDELTGRLRDLLLAQAAGKAGTIEAKAYAQGASKLHTRTFDPLPACDLICTTKPARCLFRHAAADVASDPAVGQAWDRASEADSAAADGRRTDSWRVALDAGWEIVEFPQHSEQKPAHATKARAIANQACLCVGQQLAIRQSSSALSVRRTVEQLLAEASGAMKEAPS